MMSWLVLAFLTGVATTLALLVTLVVRLVNDYQGLNLPKPFIISQYTNSFIPKALKEFYERRRRKAEPAGLAVNLLLMFLFQELKNTDMLRSWFRKKVEIELDELKAHPALRLVLRDLRLHSFNLGQSLPVIHAVKVNAEPQIDSAGQLETVDVVLELSYTGEARLLLEAEVSFNKNLSIDCKLLSLHGEARLRFTRLPYTHWSFSFTSEPAIVLDLKSNLNGRNIPQIVIPVLTNQIKRVIRRKHTLPAYKMRLRPFFTNTAYREKNASSVAGGERLEVKVVSCSRLSVDVEMSAGIFAILSAGSEKYTPRQPYEEQTFTVNLEGSAEARGQGLQLKKGRSDLLERDVLLVEKVKPGSRASLAGLVKGDIITHVNKEPVSGELSEVRQMLLDKHCDSVEVTVSQVTAQTSASTDPLASLENSGGYSEGSSRPADTEQGKQRKNGKEVRTSSLISSTEMRKCRHKYITSTVTACNSPEFEERANLVVPGDCIYLNIALFSLVKPITEQTAGERQETTTDSLIGYGSISIHDILGLCAATPQTDSQLVINLSPPPDIQSLPAYPGARELHPSRCHGDITLRFSTNSSAADSSSAQSDDIALHNGFLVVDVPASLSMATSDNQSDSSLYRTNSASRHVFEEKAFSQALSCHFCMKKIWMKKAMQCVGCHMIAHKKCIYQCQMVTQCTHEPVAPPVEPLRSSSGSENPSRAARAHNYVLQKLSKRKMQAKAVIGQSLRRKSKQRTQLQDADYSSSDEQMGDGIVASASVLQDNSDDDDSTSDEEAAFEFMKEFLSKQGKSSAATEESDELVITTAKQMGKELYASLDIEERKVKLESMVDKLQSEIEMVSAVRDEHEKSLKASATAPQRQLMLNRINKANEKIQALAVMLVHYCSGLQDCAEQLSKMSASRESSPADWADSTVLASAPNHSPPEQ